MVTGRYGKAARRDAEPQPGEASCPPKTAPEQGARFASADTIVPNPTNPQSFNRYSYTYNNPVNFTDPTGHLTQEEIENYFGFSSKQAMLDVGWNQELVDIMWTEEFTWNSVIEFEVDGVRGAAMLALFQTSGSDPFSDDATFRGGFWGVYTGEEVTADVMFSGWVSENTSLAQAESDYWQNKWEIRKPPNYTSDMYVYSVTNVQWEFVGGFLTVAGIGATGVGLVYESAILAGGSAGFTFVTGGLTFADWFGFDSPTQRITIISPNPYNHTWHKDTFFHEFTGYYQ